MSENLRSAQHGALHDAEMGAKDRDLLYLRKDANMTVQKQHQVMLISVALTVLAAILGLLFAGLVSAGCR